MQGLLPVIETMEKYEPFFKITSFSSKGRSSRMYSHKTNRIHTFLSKLARSVFLYFEFNQSVVDIREYYPLKDLKESITNISNLDFKKFSDKEGNEYTLTTTFLVTFKEEGHTTYKAFSVKHASSLKRKSTLEKLEIERRYWKSKNIEWNLITNKEVNSQVVNNIENLREVKKVGVDLSFITEELINEFKSLIVSFNGNYHDIFKNISLNKSQLIILIKYLVIEGDLEIDLTQKLNMNANIDKIVMDFYED